MKNLAKNAAHRDKRLHDLVNTQLRFQSIVNILTNQNHTHRFDRQKLLQDGDRALENMAQCWSELTKGFRT